MSESAARQSPSMLTTNHAPSSSMLRQRNRILSAQNDSSHPQIDEILAQKGYGSDTPRNGSIQRIIPVKPEVKGVSTSRPTSPLMPIVRSLEKLGEKVPSLPKMPGMPDIKLPASSIEVNFAPLQIPRQRRIQTATVAVWSLMLPICFITFLMLWQVIDYATQASNYLRSSHFCTIRHLNLSKQFHANPLALDRTVSRMDILVRQGSKSRWKDQHVVPEMESLETLCNIIKVSTYLWLLTVFGECQFDIINFHHQRKQTCRPTGHMYSDTILMASLERESAFSETRLKRRSEAHNTLTISGAFANFGTESTGFSKLFPGIKTHLLTLTSNFKIPLYRELLLFLGLCSVSKKSCSNILRMGPGSTITIVVGGAAESLAAHPGTNDLTLRKRLGFIKIAVREGADLVPVFSFGENDIYDQLQVLAKAS
ncbi:hypothetical protein QFC21_000848 [Naganishia friedmannii]|uniref:Uncharacterized protein n=1 Tax=Naganishia friedmannii TaxID=89922 RepID=A0ACC2W7F1_9TREE|nr:hypothetical protein QFC21_000848 [Naganishia friedmannii]